MPRLVLLRHAKSDWPAGYDDHDRPLSERGRRDAAAAAEWFNRQSWHIDAAVVSSAQRTQETFELIAQGLEYAVSAVVEPRIYEAPTSSILEIVRQQNQETVLIVGHGPGVPRLALALSADGIPSELERRGNYPTCAISVLESDVAWADWGPEMAAFTNFVVPRADPKDHDRD